MNVKGPKFTGFKVHRCRRAFVKFIEPEPIEQVIAAAKLAGTHEFILELPEGHDTIAAGRTC